MNIVMYVFLAIILVGSVFHLERVIMGAEQDAVDQVTAQLRKASTEIVGKIDALQAQVDAGETPDFTELREAAQALDDVVQDEIVPEAPVEE